MALALCLYFVILACFYAAITPPFEAPDEASHFLYTSNLLDTGQLPILETRAVMAREPAVESQSVQRHHPPLYYVIGALLISPTKRTDLAEYLQLNPLASIGVVADNNQNVYLHPVPTPSGDTALAVWILRLYSITLATGTVWLVYRCACLVTDDHRIALLALLLVISIPTFVHISASINNDNLVTLLHAAGIYLCLRIWQTRMIRVRDVLLAGVILGAVALTKINGLTLFGIVYGWLIFGALIRRLRWRRVALLIGVSFGMALALAGWWYLRNLQLYGDLLALQATLRIWGRGGPPHLVTPFEAKGIWESFWFILGYFNVRGPDWLYAIYLPIVSLLAVIGLILSFRRLPALRLRLLFMVGIALAAVLTLLLATSRINVSQGRILFPGLAAFAVLFVVGWTTLLGRKWGGLIVTPLTALALVTPLIYIAPAFTPATIVNAPPAGIEPLNVSGGGLTLIGYQLQTETLPADDWLRFTLYMRGSSADNLRLFVKALYPLNQDVLGGVDEAPGMLPTRSMQPNDIYTVPVRFRLDPNKVSQYPLPYQIKLLIGWRKPIGTTALASATVPLSQNGAPLVNLIVAGATVLNTVPPPAPQFSADVVYGNQIRLSGYSLSAQKLTAGQTLTITLDWQAIGSISEAWTEAIGLLDSAGKPLVTGDGSPAAYPTSGWRGGLGFAETRTLVIPATAAPGDYLLYIGWYRLANGVRLPASGSDVQNNFYVPARPLTVASGESR